jgi:poly(beta-D-mannuronate) lyase
MIKQLNLTFLLTFIILIVVVISGCVTTTPETLNVPANNFDLSHWSITVPTDTDNNGKVDVAQLETYSHADFFYLDDLGRMVFTTPNKALTTPNSSNTRSELRYMSRGSNINISGRAPANNFALNAHPDAEKFASIGSKMSATLHINAVALNAGKPEKFPAYSAVVGQIHAVKYKGDHDTAGWGNEPLKIYYKKWPGHEKGSVFWTYERNLAKNNPDRQDIAYPVWGNTWDITTDPGIKGIELGEEFSYTVNVKENTMSLTFESAAHATVRYDIDLSNNIDAHGNVDAQDNPLGYSGDALYFKAGIYDQCNVKSTEGFWYAACAGTGDWTTDRANGDYASATFSRLEVDAD